MAITVLEKFPYSDNPCKYRVSYLVDSDAEISDLPDCAIGSTAITPTDKYTLFSGGWEKALPAFVSATQNASWANNDVVNTAKTVTISGVTALARLEIENNSTETDLTVEVYETIDNEDTFITWYTIPKTQTHLNGITVSRYTKTLPSIMTGTVKLVLSNDTVVGASGAFTASVLVRGVVA